MKSNEDRARQGRIKKGDISFLAELHVMGYWVSVLCVGGMLAGTPPQDAIGSYLYEPSYCMDSQLRGKARPYLPQPGDVLLATDKNIFWKITHDLALAFEPHNSAIIVARHDGSLAVLEAGPNDTL